MARSLFSRRNVRSRPAQTPEDTVLWSVGDVHGRCDLLNPVLNVIRADLEASDAARKVVIFLGDYVDRGPASREVLDALLAVTEWRGVEAVFLRGNHEEEMQTFLGDASAGPRWCEFGGRETLRCYGVHPPLLKSDEQGWMDASAALNAAMPAAQQDFLGRLQMSFSAGDYFFAHAGARPGVKLDEQSNRDLMWIRAAFLTSTEAFDRIVVHGHTPDAQVVADHRRIGIDTGAYATGVLTALRLEDTRRTVVQTLLQAGHIGLIQRNLPNGVVCQIP